LSQIRFARGLADEFVSELGAGCLEQLIRSAVSRQLDVQIREHNIDIYACGRCVINLAHSRQRGIYKAKIHSKYLNGVHWPVSLDIGSDNYCRFAFDAASMGSYITSIDQIIRNAIALAEPEATIEEKLIQASHRPESPLIFFDRQVQLHGVQKRMDMIGLALHPEPKIILTELKQGLDNRIQKLMDQISSYYDLIAPDGHLREDVFVSYTNVIEQKKKLGLMPPEINMPKDRPAVECLIVLYDYNERSELLGRLVDAAKQHTLPVRLVSLPEEQFAIPPMLDWRILS
jgi:hypothetical protein